MGMLEAFFVTGVLLKGAIDDVQTLTVSREWFVFGWGLLALWQLSHGHVFPVLFLLALLLWGMGHGPGWAALLFLPFFPYWPLLLFAAGAREGVVGNGDVIALALISLYSPWGAWLAFIGILLWWGYQRKLGKPWTPALPGLLLGFSLFVMYGFWMG